MATIVDICWDRIYLEYHIDGIGAKAPRFFLKSLKNNQRIEVPCDRNVIRLNITNMTGIRNQEMLAAGLWELISVSDDSEQSIPLAAAVIGKLDKLSRVFPYCDHKYAYAVAFEMNEGKGASCFVLSSMYYQVNKNPKKGNIMLESDSTHDLIVNAATSVATALVRFIYFISSNIRKKNGTRILMMSETKTGMTGNLLSLSNWLGLNRPSYHLTYSFHETLNMKKSRVVPVWIKLVWLMGKQDIILVDDYAPIFKVLNLHPGTKLIQVWHAGVGFKSVGYSRFGKEDSPRPFQSAHRKYDYAIVGSTGLIPVYSEVFGIPKTRILPTGLPKIDDFLDPRHLISSRTELEGRHSGLRGKKIILFAPTYRGFGQSEAYYPFEMLDLDRILQFCGEEWIFVVKMHPFVSDPPIIPSKYSTHIMDLSHENVDTLLHAADMLITDYSSIIYEYSLLDKPILFFAFDKEEYKLSRGFHWNFEENAPGEICTTFEELMQGMNEQRIHKDKVMKFRTFAFDHNDRMSCERFCKFMDILLDKSTN